MSKKISDERVRELDKRILRLTGSRHFEMDEWVDVMVHVAINNLLYFFFSFVVCGAVLLFILMGDFTSSPRVVASLTLSSLGFTLYWVRVIRACLAWRELRATIY